MKPMEFNFQLEIDAPHIQATLSAILNSIIFYRYFSPVKPTKNVALGTISYPVIDDTQTEQLINSKISQVVKDFELNTTFHNLSIGFTSKVTKKTWFSTNEESVCWERWILDIRTYTSPESERGENYEKLKIDLRNTLLRIIDLVDSNKDHIPLISNSEANPFPFEISLVSSNEKLKSVFKRG